MSGLDQLLASLMGGAGRGGGRGRGGMSASYFDPSQIEIPDDDDVDDVIFAQRPVCGCSYRTPFGKCPNHSIPFADCHSFPRFKDLPNYHEPFGRYFNGTSGVMMPSRPWFFMGELSSDAIPFLRSRCPLSTRHGDRGAPIMFYPEDDEDSAYLTAQQPKMRKGATIVLSSPMWKVFMDGQHGIREEGRSYYVFGAPLKAVTRYGRLLLHNADAAHVKRPEEAVCVVCARTAADTVAGGVAGAAAAAATAPITPTTRKLSCCGKCKTALYCSVDCQRKDWAGAGPTAAGEGLSGFHKALCGDSQRLLIIASGHRAKTANNRANVYTCDAYVPPATAAKRFNILSFTSDADAPAATDANASNNGVANKEGVGAAVEGVEEEEAWEVEKGPSSFMTREDLLNGAMEALAYGTSSPFAQKKTTEGGGGGRKKRRSRINKQKYQKKKEEEEESYTDHDDE